MSTLESILSPIFARHNDSFTYVLPFRVGESYFITQGYGGLHSHTGKSYFSLDFGLPEMTPVCASRTGVIRAQQMVYGRGGESRENARLVNFIEIEHDDRSVAFYAHLMQNSQKFEIGQAVKTGEVIALSGLSGWTNGAHLHFHVEIQGERVSTHFATNHGNRHLLIKGVRYAHPESKGQFGILEKNSN